MAALSTLRGYVRDELGELTAGQWSDSQINSWLNRGVDYCVAEFFRGKCWKLLRKLIKDKSYTVPVSETEHSMWQVIDNKRTGGSATNTWYGFVHAMLGNYVLHVGTMEEFHRLNATTGEYEPSTTEPWLIFTGYDRGEKYLSYTSGSVEPAMDGYLLGAVGGASCYVAFTPPPTSAPRHGSFPSLIQESNKSHVAPSKPITITFLLFISIRLCLNVLYPVFFIKFNCFFETYFYICYWFPF